jgi:hypothetical protein
MIYALYLLEFLYDQEIQYRHLSFVALNDIHANSQWGKYVYLYSVF